MPLAAINNTIEFVVLDIEPTQHPPITSNRGKFLLADAQITPASGGNDETFHTRTHLGAVLKPGDTVIGYYLSTSNFNDSNWESLNSNRVPEVILVRKTFPARRKKGGNSAKKRKWKLKSMAKEVGEENIGLGRERANNEKKNGRGFTEQAKAEADYELFLRDLEEDAELRANVQLWKAEKKKRGETDGDDGMETESVAETEATDMSDDDEDFPKIKDDELLIEGMTNMKMDDIAEGAEEEV
jgi:nonsense-mediated mRNA decay protein 3